jgi:acyl-coenzyme A thioesterase PaaI-like protein
VGHILRRGKRAVVTRVDIYDGRDGPLAAACQLAFTIVRPTRPT